MTERKVNRKTRTGVVVSDVNDQTAIVAVTAAARHRLYRKVIRRTRRYPVHDPENRATVGDLVVIEECRPISKTKRWRLVGVVTEREVAEVRPESIDEALVGEVQRSAARAAAESEPDGAGGDAREPSDGGGVEEHGEPDGAGADAVEPDAGEPDGAGGDAGEPSDGGGVEEHGEPDGAGADAVELDAGEPDGADAVEPSDGGGVEERGEQ